MCKYFFHLVNFLLEKIINLDCSLVSNQCTCIHSYIYMNELIFLHLFWLDSHLFASSVAVSLRRYI